MKKTTKVLAVLTAALMAFAVIGCNNPSASGNTPDPTTSNPTTPDPTTPDPTTPDPTTPDPTTPDPTTPDPTTPDPTTPDPITLVENLSLGWSGTDTITAGKDIAAGGTIYFTITTTGKQELQFIKKGWAGGLGTGVITILNADGNDVTYYAKGEGATDPKDRPAVSLEDSTATFHFVVTDAYVALKEEAVVVGSAKLDKMWYVAE